MDFLAKNAEQIAKYNKPLADKILSHVIESDSYFLDYTKCDDLNLYINGVPVHDEIDPVSQAKSIFDKTYQPGNVSIIFGLGLGYLFNRFVKESKEKILIYESNIDVLRITLGLFDFSEALSNPKIRLVHDKFNLKSNIETVNVKDDKFTVYFLPFHNVNYKEELEEFVRDLTSIHGLIDIGFKELARQSKNWGFNTIGNLGKIHYNNELESLRNKFINKPCIIASAGPSLSKSMDAIKKYRDKVIVIAVSTSLKTLLKNGIEPDFTAIIEAGNCIQNISGVDVSNLKFIFPPEVNPRIYESGQVSKCFNYYTENLFTSDWVQEFTGVDCSAYINRGTVSITALWSAKTMGCNPIILTGQDLAYVDGKCYAGDVLFGLRCIVDQQTGAIDFETPQFESQQDIITNFYNTNDPVQIKKILDDYIESKRKDVAVVKGQNGDILPTSQGYALFVKHFEELIPEFDGVKLYNASTGGAQLDGYENIEMEKVLEQYATESINLDSLIAEAVKEYQKPNNFEQKMEFFNKNISQLEEYIHHCSKGSASIKKFKQQLTRTRKITSDLKNILFKAIEAYYEAIQKNYTKNRYIMSMSYKEFTDTESSLKNFDKSRSDEDLLLLVENVTTFFKTAIQNSELSIDILKKQKAKISESVTSKS